jgi:hypothetical protein
MTTQRAEPMGLDISNGLIGNLHLSWTGTEWFRGWCSDSGLPEPFIGWESGGNEGDQCLLKTNPRQIQLAEEWCRALEQKVPDLAQLGKELAVHPPEDISPYLYPHGGSKSGVALAKEWRRRFVATWYAILRNGLTHGDTLEYW